MLKRITSVILVLSFVFLMSACGGIYDIYDKEYYSVAEYTPVPQKTNELADRITVHSFSELKQALISFVNSGSDSGRIVFDESYHGDPREDLSGACWEVRTQDALCAYCVENISYDLNKIVTYYESVISIRYSAGAAPVEDLITLQYSTEMEQCILSVLKENTSSAVLLVNQSTYTGEGVENLVSSVYRANPVSCPHEPDVSVTVFNGTGFQKLYEIKLDYGMTEEELLYRTGQLNEVSVFPSYNFDNCSELLKAYYACLYLCENCSLSDSAKDCSVYDALVLNRANDEGIALAYVALCKQLGLDCRIVFGQHNREDKCWNIVNINNDFYHVDVSSCINNGFESGFALNDEVMWGPYRWSVFAYPACSGTLGYDTVFADS